MAGVVTMTTALRCLIVDDSPTFRDAARSMLQCAGFDVVGMASSSAEALECFRRLRPDVTLVDVDLGAESGFDLARALHEANSLAPSVILISTHSEQDLQDLIADSPALGFVSKISLSPQAIRALLVRND